MAATTEEISLLAPLANRTFAALWVASIVSSVRPAMHTMGASWTLVQVGTPERPWRSPSPAHAAQAQSAETTAVPSLQERSLTPQGGSQIARRS
ncbi:MFS transporter [Belnapia sp. T18]|uniref:MFS transporter n=1 Tax=Belnapia arida TaxID=2804533 RepID=A0ABS1UAI8_9PROT|nr:MFS transporter [Belnapia arida]